MTLQLPPTETKTVTNYHTGEDALATTDYFMARVGSGKATHLASETTYSNGQTSRLFTSCGAGSYYRNRRPRKINTGTITCKKCLKQLDKMNN